MSVDLHLHTHYSDGNWSPESLINRACELGFDTIAITDHDTTAALKESRELCANRIRLIDGIEFNTVAKNSAGKVKDIHILGYFVDPLNSKLQEACERQRNARIQQVEETVRIFQSKGHDISLDDVTRQAGKGSIGRPHICKAMLEKGITKEAQQAYRMLMNYDSEYRVERLSIHPEEAIAAIAAAGGVSSLAHPGKEIGIEMQIQQLREYGLNAVEVYHRSHTLSLIKKYLKIAAKNGLLATGGSDCHGPYENFPGSIGSIRLAPDIVQRLEAFVADKRNRVTV